MGTTVTERSFLVLENSDTQAGTNLIVGQNTRHQRLIDTAWIRLEQEQHTLTGDCIFLQEARP
jgi:hypothetical protein